MDAATRKPALMAAPVPVYFFFSFLTAYAVDRLVPLPRPSPDVAEKLRVAGWMVFTLGHLIMFAGLGWFARARTTIIPHGTARTLVTTGIYSVTRNPMYLGLTIAYVGLTSQQRLLWAIPFIAVPLFVAVRVVIPFEEARLRSLFGDAYAAYCARVRRWI